MLRCKSLLNMWIDWHDELANSFGKSCQNVKIKRSQMPKLISFLSWNVENFHTDSSRVDDVVDLIASKNPDVFGI